MESEEEGGGRIRQLRGRRRRLEHFLEGSAGREGGRGLEDILEGGARRKWGRGSRGIKEMLEGSAQEGVG